MQVRCSMFVDVVVGISVEEKQSAIDAVEQAPFDVRCYMSVDVHVSVSWPIRNM